MKNIRFLWYSPSQINARDETFEFGRRHKSRIYYKTLSGKVVQVSEVTRGLRPWGAWKDYRFVGIGTFHHLESCGK